MNMSFLDILRKYSRTTYSSDLKYVYYPFHSKLYGIVFFILHSAGVTCYKEKELINEFFFINKIQGANTLENWFIENKY